MNSKQPLLLDLYCGAGGASSGYAKAGYRVVGFDLYKQPHHPYEHYTADAIEVLEALAMRGRYGFFEAQHVAAIHTSPSCKGYSIASRCRPGLIERHERHIPIVRYYLTQLYEQYGIRGVIENVPLARGEMRSPVLLCGEMFGLRVLRHRLFETIGWSMSQPAHVPHRGGVKDGVYLTVAGHGHQAKDPFCTADDWREAMQIDWMNRDELAQALPPAYTEYVGKAMIA